MAHRSKVTATYQPCPGEAFEVTVSGDPTFPDVYDELRAQAVRGVTELMYAAIGAYPERETAEGTADD
jgi:hypothetical protein